MNFNLPKNINFKEKNIHEIAKQYNFNINNIEYCISCYKHLSFFNHSLYCEKCEKPGLIYINENDTEPTLVCSGCHKKILCCFGGHCAECTAENLHKFFYLYYCDKNFLHLCNKRYRWNYIKEFEDIDHLSDLKIHYDFKIDINDKDFKDNWSDYSSYKKDYIKIRKLKRSKSWEYDITRLDDYI